MFWVSSIYLGLFCYVGILLLYFKMERQQYGLKVGFWNVNGLSEEKASDDLLQNKIR